MISIVTSLYKSEEYLPVFIKRVKRVGIFLEKNNISFELVIIANDPTERELEYLNNFSSRCPWVRIENVSRETLYASWNRGLRISKGNSLCFWNVDDIRFAKALVKGAKLIESGEKVVYFPFIYFRYLRFFCFKVLVKVAIIFPPKFDRKRFCREMHIGPFFMFSKEFFKEVGDFDQSFKIAGDFDWQTRAAKIGSFYMSPPLSGIFKNDGRSLSGSKNVLQKQENELIYKRCL